MAKPTPHVAKNEYHGDIVELAEQFAGWHTEWAELETAQHDAMEKSHDYYHGKQMSDADEKALRDSGRPIITINKVSPAVDAIYGAVIHNALGFSYVSPHPSDKSGQLLPRPDELMDGTAQYVRARYGADGKDRAAILDMMIGGIGCQEMRTDARISDDLEIVVDHIDPFAVGWDTRARACGLADRRWDFTRWKLSDDEFEAEFGLKPEDVEAQGGDDSMDTKEDLASHADDPHDIYRWQWFEYEDYRVYIVPDTGPDGNIALDPMTGQVATRKVSANAEEAKAFPFVISKSDVRKRRVYWEARTYGPAKIIEVYRLGVNRFTRTFITGKRDRRTGVWYGIVRHAESPQQWANTFFSGILYIMMHGGKGYVVEEGVFQDKDQAQRDWALPDKLKFVNEGMIERIQPIQPQQLPPGLSDMAMMAIAFVPEVLGASLELRGLQSNNQSGVTETARQDASIGVIGWIFSELREFYRRHGELLLDFMVRYIEPGRMIRMTTNDGEAYKQFQPPGKDVHYDVVVDDVPSSPNRRRAVFNALASLVPFFQLDPTQIPPGTGVELLRSSPLPGEVVRRLEANAAKPNPQAEQAQQIQMATAMKELEKLAAEVDEIRAQAMLNMAKAKETGQDAETAQRIAETEIQQKVIEGNFDLAIKQQKAMLDGEEQLRDLAFKERGQDIALRGQIMQQQVRANEPRRDRSNSE